MGKTLLTKRNIFSDKRLSIEHGFQLLPQILLKYFNCDNYKLIIESDGKILTIKYEATKFSLEDLKNTELPENYNGGNGKRLLTEETDYMTYRYIDGWNIYELDFGENEINEFKEEYEVYGVTSRYSWDILELIYSNVSIDENGYYEKWVAAVEELILNILMNTNILNYTYEVLGKYIIIYDEEDMEIDRIGMTLFTQIGNKEFEIKNGFDLNLEDLEEIAKYTSKKNKSDITLKYNKEKVKIKISDNDMVHIENIYNVRIKIEGE